MENNDPSLEIIKVSEEIADNHFSKDKKARLAFLINELVVHDFNALVQLLYRIDVDEKKLKSFLSRQLGEDAASIISDLIIERQIQKYKSRNEFRRDNTSDEEVW
jgi:translation initiation factor 2 beta subunit (eIF-2beta)/eIF-5